MKRLGLVVLASLGLACRSEAPTPAPEAEPESTPAPVASFVGSGACADCHAAEAEAHASSAHARTLRSVGEASELRFDDEAPIADDAKALGRVAEPSSIVATDAEGDEAARQAQHVIGSGRRQSALLHALDGSLQVLPLAWSTHAAEWSDFARTEGWPNELDRWTSRAATWRESCAGCHPMASAAAGEDVPNTPEQARGLEPGIGCEHCHGPGGSHVELARQEAAASDLKASISRSAPDEFSGCAHCHSRGTELALFEGPALRPSDPIHEHRLFEQALGPMGPNARSFADGRPGDAHGRLALSFEQSACFLRGEARCTSCHDPHGRPIEDPDAGCRSCHAEQAADPAAHAKHPVLASTVPRASDEPDGPSAGRAPGCVDCHAPAILAFGDGGRVRDHAFGNPEPELSREFGTPGACIACHADDSPSVLVSWIEENFPDRKTPRTERARALRETLYVAAGRLEQPSAESLDLLDALVADREGSRSLRASAAQALLAIGPQADGSVPTLQAALNDPAAEVAAAAAAALGSIGSQDRSELRQLAREGADWRVRLAAAAALERLGEDDGSSEMALMADDAKLPVSARAQARLQLGVALQRRGALERAAFQFERATRLDAELALAWLNLGVVRVGLDDPEGARLAWLTVLDLEPDDALARSNLARLDAQ